RSMRVTYVADVDADADTVYAQSQYVVPGVVEAGPQQVVHGRVQHQELALLALLHPQHARQQQAGLGHQVTARLEHDPALEALQRRADLGDVVHGIERALALAVAHAEAAADVDAGEPVARRLELAPEPGQPLQRLPDRGHVQQLRADVHVQSVQAHVRPRRLSFEPGPRLGDRDAELVL